MLHLNKKICKLLLIVDYYIHLSCDTHNVLVAVLSGPLQVPFVILGYLFSVLEIVSFYNTINHLTTQMNNETSF